MPHFTVTIGTDGPTIDLAVAVGRPWQRRLAAQEAPASAPSIVRAMIDTGSDLTVVHPEVLRSLGVPATGAVRIRRPGAGGGFLHAATYDVQLALGGARPGTPWIATQVIGVPPATPTVLGLIGRDVLENCTLFYNGPRGELTLSY